MKKSMAASSAKYMIALAASATLVAGCQDNPVTNPVGSPTVEQVQGSLTRSSLQVLATGITAENRGDAGTTTYLILSGIYARNFYRLDPSEPRYVSETLGGAPDPGGFSGSGGWSGFYTGIRAAKTLIAAVPSAQSTELSNAEKSAVLGFAKTMEALQYYQVLQLRDTLGIVIQGDDPNKVDPIVCKTKALNYIAALLDSANTDLAAAGGATSMPFKLPSGFTAFGTDYSKVSNFILFNRGLKGEVDLYRGLDHQAPNAAANTAAIAELTQALGGAAAGAVPSSSMTNGVYYVFVAGGTENTPNPWPDSHIGLNPQVADSIRPGDTRKSKIVPLKTPIAGQGIQTNTTYVQADATNSANLSAPIALLTNEELVLLRAQAYIQAGDLPSALKDVNSVRTTYGLVALTSFASATDAINEVLYEKRYSLLGQGPKRLVDLRAYGRLNAANYKAEVTGDPFNSAFPIPKPEADARSNQIAPSCS